VIFTNLGHDHLDLHGSQEAYFRAKARLFSSEFSNLGVINVGDPYGRLIADTARNEVAGREFRVVTYCTDDVSDVEVTAGAHRYVWRGRRVEVPMGGDFNVANSLAALTTAVELGIDVDVAIGAVSTLPGVAGRFEMIDTDESRRRDLTILVDYAHTPDGLERVLEAARGVAGTSGSLVVVFGCGGDRDRAKRPTMGAVASRCADRVVITSDNPRRESPEVIIREIVEGVDPTSSATIVTIADRRAAICDAIATAEAGDVIVIAGKGHETTQEFADRTIEFDDRAVARDCLEAYG
jgi:UDP-N-acetylmuramoyl-L-alanyl-D-glutamate--2,6-diaminopimelate ligase